MKLTRRSLSFQSLLIVIALLDLASAMGPRASASVDPLDIPSTAPAPAPRNVKDELRLAGDYFAGRGVAQNLNAAAQWYEKAAGEGNLEAQLQIGYLYEAGIGVPRDPVRAFHWFQLADAGGMVRAKVSLAIAYLWGTGVAKNEQLALRFFAEAASKGNGLAAACLGEMYQLGIGAPQDQVAAEQWYIRGAKQHDPQAEFRLGSLFSEQAGHAHDLRKAMKLLRESASSGYIPAMHLAGYLLIIHPELARSRQEAAGLLNESANAGAWRSSLVLGILARDGKGEPVNAGEAYYRFRVAALQGGMEASEFLRKDLANLSNQLGPERASQIDAQAAQWYQRHQLVLEFVYKKHADESSFPAYALAQPEEGMHAAQLIPSRIN